MGVYNEWVEKSLQKLAEFIPARYDKPEEASGILSSLDTYIYEIVRPETPAPIEAQAEIPAQAEQTGTATYLMRPNSSGKRHKWIKPQGGKRCMVSI
jgi:hypothetical protein